MNSGRNWERQGMLGKSGFTLVELLVTLAVLAILTTLAYPDMRGLIVSNRIASQSSDFTTAFVLARSEAIKRGGPVCIKRKGASWSNGWEVFVDAATAASVAASDYCKSKNTNPNNESPAPAKPPVIQDYNALSGGSTLTSSAFSTAVRFSAMGIAVDKDNAPIAGSFTLCPGDADALRSKKLEVSVMGAIRTLGNQGGSCP